MSRRPIHRGRVVDLGIEEAVLPDGRRIALEVVHHPGGAAAVALEAGRVCLLRQYRHAAGGWLWELPAGKIDRGEDPLETARRELAEEAGVEAARWTPVASFLTTPGFCDEVIHVFRAEGLRRVGTAHERHECIEVHWVDAGEALAWCRDGTIRDAKTLIGLLLALAPPAGRIPPQRGGRRSP
ncbi:NUDIX hydrolase [Inmirania thermothiophila]|uniref:GDP-mannose pyrophosphatase n=1 Tax=Inmirania thermothiophila TaxID=1750597 RepID=A0A3N1Y5A8_9GAMM|nr:NUDIX hydrolase [Inmirania thermothiophila]ROR32822.1 ADP-ribose pyrophosphatase [Inmirania thermothiophila]